MSRSDGDPLQRLAAQLRFAREAERLKTVERHNLVHDRSRRENSAEHSFSLALLVELLFEHAPRGIDRHRALQLALLHDLVEIDAGDTFCHDEEAHRDKAQREQRAATRLYGLLPPEQGQRWRQLWEEFETGGSAEARLVAAIDRLQPVLLHELTDGAAWREAGIRRSQVLARVAPIECELPRLWPVVVELIDRAVAAGWLAEG